MMLAAAADPDVGSIAVVNRAGNVALHEKSNLVTSYHTGGSGISSGNM